MKRNKSIYLGYTLFLLIVTYFFIKIEQDFPENILQVTFLMTSAYRFLFIYSIAIFISAQQILKYAYSLPVLFRYTNRSELAARLTMLILKTSFRLCLSLFIAIIVNCVLLNIPIFGTELFVSLIICFIGYFIGICIYEMIFLILCFWWSKAVGGFVYFLLIGIDFTLWFIQIGLNLIINRMNFSHVISWEKSVIKINSGAFLKEFTILLLIFFLLRILFLFTLEKKEFLGVKK